MDHSYLYSTRIQKTFDEDVDEILSSIKQELEKNSHLNVRLINYYKGLPVSYPAKIVSVDKQVIEVDSIPQQIFTIKEHSYTFIRSRLFRHDIYTQVQYANIKRRAISLHKPQYVEILAEKRDYVRLELEQQRNALLITSTGIIRGKLIELAINGACVVSSDPVSLEQDADLTLSFMLNDKHHNLEYNVKTPARLMGVESNEKHHYYRFSTMPDKILDRQLAQFLFQRQIEIINEIKDATDIVN